MRNDVKLENLEADDSAGNFLRCSETLGTRDGSHVTAFGETSSRSSFRTNRNDNHEELNARTR